MLQHKELQPLPPPTTISTHTHTSTPHDAKNEKNVQVQQEINGNW